MGILPQAMLNFLALLGLSPGNNIEIMTVPQMIELFSADHLLKKASVFDTTKLEWMNGQHLSLLSSAEIEPRVTPAIVKEGLATADELAARRDWYLSLLDQLKVRSRTIDDIVRQATPFLTDEIDYDPAAEAKQWKDRPATAELLRAVGERLGGLPAWELAPMEEALRALAESRGMKDGKVFQPLRVALTGLAVSPGIFDVLALLGRERSLARIAAAVQRLEAPAAE